MYERPNWMDINRELRHGACIEIETLPPCGVRKFLLFLRQRKIAGVAVYGGAVRDLLAERYPHTTDLDLVYFPVDNDVKMIREHTEAIDRQLAEAFGVDIKQIQWQGAPFQLRWDVDKVSIPISGDGTIIDPDQVMLPTMTVNCIGITPAGQILDFAGGIGDLRDHRAVFTQNHVHPLKEPLDKVLLHRARLSTEFLQRIKILPPSPQLDVSSHSEKIIVHQLLRLVIIASQLDLIFNEADKLAIRRFFTGLQSPENVRETALSILNERVGAMPDEKQRKLRTMLTDIGADCIIGSLDAVLSDLRHDLLFDDLPY